MNLQATAIIQGVDQKFKQGKSIFVVAHGENQEHLVVEEEERGNMKFSVWRDIADASKKTDVKIHASHQEALKLCNDDRHALAKKNLLKGVTADENTCIHVKTQISLSPSTPTFLFTALNFLPFCCSRIAPT
jgi:hypothetical protein